MSDTLRNPSEREVQSLIKKDYIPKAEIIKDNEVRTSASESEDVRNTSDIPMKPSDDFEPEPLKFKLASGKSVVNSKYLTDNNEIFVRKLSLKEEGFFSESATGTKFYAGLNRILRECIKTDINENTLSAIDKIPLVIFILAITYGSVYNIGPIEGCKTCTKSNKVILNLLEDIEINYVPETFSYPLKIRLNFEGADINLTMHYPRIMNEEIVFDSNNIFEQIKSLIISIDGIKKNGKKVEISDYDSIITYLSSIDKEKIMNFLLEYSKFGIQTKTSKFKCSKAEEEGKASCEMCKNDSKIDINLEKIFSVIGDKISKNKIV